MYTASLLNQCRCAHQAVSVINRHRRSFEEDITSRRKEPNPGSLPAIMAKIALKGKCLGKAAIAAIASPKACNCLRKNKVLKKAEAFFNPNLIFIRGGDFGQKK
jgi:hypothetical protein